MHRLLLIVLAVFVGCFILSVFTLMMKEGLSMGDATTVVMCSYSRVLRGYLSGRWNVSSTLTTVQCMSDKL